MTGIYKTPRGVYVYIEDHRFYTTLTGWINMDPIPEKLLELEEEDLYDEKYDQLVIEVNTFLGRRYDRAKQREPD